MNVLLADDASTDLHSLEKCLLVAAGRLNIPIQIVGKARHSDALCEMYRALTAEQLPVVVFCDLQLPGTDGFGALVRLRQINPEQKIVVMSKRDRLPAARESSADVLKEMEVWGRLTIAAERVRYNLPAPGNALTLLGTAESLQLDPVQAADYLGADAYVSKPFDVDTITEVLRSLIASASFRAY